MAGDGPQFDPFQSDSLWKPSIFSEDPESYTSCLFGPIELDIPSIKLQNPYAPTATLDRELRLPDLDTFEFGPLPELEDLEQPLSAVEESLGTEEDLWEVALDLGPANKHVVFWTWESFEDSDHAQTYSPYTSEAGPAAFDAVLQARSTQAEDAAAGNVLRNDILLGSLLNLGLGRSSILFSFDPKRKIFAPTIGDGRSSGLSVTSVQSLIQQFIHTGNTFRYLQSFAARTFASAKSIPARVALATSVSTVLSAFEDHLGAHFRNLQSALQLQRLFVKPREVLIHVARLVDATRSARTNEQLASILHHRLLELEEGDQHLRALTCQILCRVAEPSLELIEEWIGIRKEDGSAPFAERNSFVTVGVSSDSQDAPEYAYNPDRMPRFVSQEEGKMIFEIGNSLQFLKLHHPNHPLVACQEHRVETPKLEWKFAWRDIERISEKAKAHEDSLREAIRTFSQHPSKQHTSGEPVITAIGTSRETCWDLEESLDKSTQLLDQRPMPLFHTLPDDLQAVVERITSDGRGVAEDAFSPPLSMTPMLSFGPLLAAQAKLVNTTTLRLFFRAHDLRLHLSLQRQYHLFGDGVFSTRLASALFDPELENAERRKGTMRSGVHMGLQLGSRSNWPPASSELRLALMGVLSESYYSSALYSSTVTKRPDAGFAGISPVQVSESTDRNREELPGRLNFGIRNLSEAEMEKIIDPDSLYALDFLRLQYIPPSPLHLVMTSVSMEKYDYIFKFLLRLLRMLFVVSHLPRRYADVESRQFRSEAHQFVTALSSYIYQTGIAEHWEHFESFVDSVEKRLSEEGDAGELGTRVKEGLDSLRDAHEQCLDSIMFSLLLRRRQTKVMALLEDIFEHILLFAKMQKRADIQEDVKELHAKLRGKVKVFISVCRGLTGKRGYGKGKGTGEENTIERLLVSLEMNGYYSG